MRACGRATRWSAGRSGSATSPTALRSSVRSPRCGPMRSSTAPRGHGSTPPRSTRPRRRRSTPPALGSSRRACAVRRHSMLPRQHRLRVRRHRDRRRSPRMRWRRRGPPTGGPSGTARSPSGSGARTTSSCEPAGSTGARVRTSCSRCCAWPRNVPSSGWSRTSTGRRPGPDTSHRRCSGSSRSHLLGPITSPTAV